MASTVGGSRAEGALSPAQGEVQSKYSIAFSSVNMMFQVLDTFFLGACLNHVYSLYPSDISKSDMA